MNIAEFIIKKIFQPRLKDYGCMVVYDPDRRYHSVCVSMASDECHVVDASESSIESRFEALRLLGDLGKPKAKIKSLLVYVPARKPITEEQKQVDPFALYGECGTVFPKDDGDDFISICLRAKPENAVDIRRVFGQTQSPTFEMIDNIGRGSKWTQLPAILKTESTNDILIALLTPTDEQIKAMKEQESWGQEARELLNTTLGMVVKTKAKSWDILAEELWMYILFSEFVFDLPGKLPNQLETVPRAVKEAKTIINGICDRLRSDSRTRSKYIEQAEKIQEEIKLPDFCRDIEDLGERDTFPFEERTFLRRAIDGITKNDTDCTRQLLNRHKNSVWLGKGESQEQWKLVQAALSFIEACEVFDVQLLDNSRSQEALLDFYVTSFREVDRLQREFEHAASVTLSTDVTFNELFDGVIQQARKKYGKLVGKAQQFFIRYLETAGWPPTGRLANIDVYQRFVAEKLKDRNQKIAYFMIDALRYELGVALEKMLLEDGAVELHHACAQLPTITSVGMASLLPGARTELFLDNVEDSLVPKIDNEPVTTVSQRMEVFRKQLGDRFMEMKLEEFVAKKPRIPSTVDLLVLRNNEIDEQLENNRPLSLSLVPYTLKQIRIALHKLKGIGFSEAVIATDHGFFLNTHAETGDVCAKPNGTWLVKTHDRMLFGNGVADNYNFVISTEKLGIRSVFTQCAGPKNVVSYSSRATYFHGGASLAETVVPVLVVKMETVAKATQQKFEIELSYKNGAKKITTRIPVIQITLQADKKHPLLSLETDVEILLEAYDSKGDVVGEPRPGGDVNPTTRTIILKPGEPKQIAIRMVADFEGKFTIKALNPTTSTAYGSINLETDYTV